MPDTLIEEPIRPTVTDDLASPAPAAEGDPAPADARPAPPGEAAPRRPGRPRGAACLVVAIALAALLAGAALGVYFLFWRYVPTARQHIPGDANIVVRLETADLALFGPVRQHFLPLLDDAPRTASRKARIEAATGLDFPSDLREIVVASTDAASWVALAGGRIPKGRFVAGMEKVARDEGWTGVRREGELLLLGPRAVLGQADDGTIVLGTDVEIVKAALPASPDADEWRRLDLPEQGAVTFALTSAAWSGAAAAASGVLPRAGALFRRIDHASGTLTLGAEPALSMLLAPASGEAAAALAPDTQAFLGSLKLALALLPDVVDVVGARAALEGAQALAQGDLVEIRTKWPHEGLDRACAELAHRARAARDALDASAPAGAP
ncbi:putative membrane protein [Sorangium cellulosum So ce56]|uniref:Membrane protein n=1 Tax=Sorangium cellulosum (strain So ce56) TaxID=448385 RepID=A9GU83_SORC5|nr:hypothetical protein [Sorangium cellulosum]CAN97048.1 putative membrane protein [Sorangium cellulosum So ce56]